MSLDHFVACREKRSFHVSSQEAGFVELPAAEAVQTPVLEALENRMLMAAGAVAGL